MSASCTYASVGSGPQRTQHLTRLLLVAPLISVQMTKRRAESGLLLGRNTGMSCEVTTGSSVETSCSYVRVETGGRD